MSRKSESEAHMDG